jgi:L-aminopeptidase/D-esterase-like protein
MIHGMRVGHAQNDAACTGCTVLIGPFRAAVDVRGMGTGSRELGTLDALHVVERVDAILLTGGSAFGLAAADGVMSWLEENGRGYDTIAARVPIVPAAVIYDLAIGDARIRPDASMGRRACENAFADDAVVTRGRIGAGTGASAGKILGAASATRTGLGTASMSVAGYTVVALAVVNPLGDVLDAEGRTIAGPRDGNGAFASTRELLMQAPASPFEVAPGTNTTLVVVATDAPLSRVDLERLARTAATGVARRIAPVHTPFDGDVVFAVSTSETVQPVGSPLMLALGSAAATAVEHAIGNSCDA